MPFSSPAFAIIECGANRQRIAHNRTVRGTHHPRCVSDAPCEVGESNVRRGERVRKAALRVPLSVAALVSVVWGCAYAQTYPTKPIRMLFGSTAGSGAGDQSARLLAQKMTDILGQNVIVDNRPGAGGAIADDAAVRASADGYTLLYAAGSSAILPLLRPRLGYNIERDLAPVSLVVITSFAMS